MRFSIFLNARSMDPAADRGLIRDLIQHATLGESLGFDGLFLPDHHFTGYMPIASDPFIFAAYLAATLRKFHFGFSVTSVPLHNPVRLVERINILDQLTGGRILVGVGSGTTPEEMVGFGVSYKEAGSIAENNLAIAESLWAKQMRDPPIKYENGPFRGEVLQRIAPAPFTAPHARLMPVALKETSARRAAQNGWPAFIPAFTPPKIGGTEPFKHVKKHFDTYKEMLLAAGHSESVIADALSWSTHTYQCVHLAESDAQAREEVEVILTAYQQAVDREKAFNDKAEETAANQKTDRTPEALTEDWMGTWCLYGSPRTVIEKLAPYAQLGIGNILCGTTTGPLDEQRLRWSNQTLELLAREVLPHFRTSGRAAS